MTHLASGAMLCWNHDGAVVQVFVPAQARRRGLALQLCEKATAVSQVIGRVATPRPPTVEETDLSTEGEALVRSWERRQSQLITR